MSRDYVKKLRDALEADKEVKPIPKEVLDRVETWVIYLGLEQYGHAVSDWTIDQWEDFYSRIRKK